MQPVVNVFTNLISQKWYIFYFICIIDPLYYVSSFKADCKDKNLHLSEAFCIWTLQNFAIGSLSIT